MSERELLKLRGVGDRLIADVGKPLHATDEIFFLSHSHRRRQLLSLEFLESPDRRGINLAARNYKTNKESAVVCRSPLRRLSQTEK